MIVTDHFVDTRCQSWINSDDALDDIDILVNLILSKRFQFAYSQRLKQKKLFNPYITLMSHFHTAENY